MAGLNGVEYWLLLALKQFFLPYKFLVRVKYACFLLKLLNEWINYRTILVHLNLKWTLPKCIGSLETTKDSSFLLYLSCFLVQSCSFLNVGEILLASSLLSLLLLVSLTAYLLDFFVYMSPAYDWIHSDGFYASIMYACVLPSILEICEWSG